VPVVSIEIKELLPLFLLRGGFDRGVTVVFFATKIFDLLYKLQQG
jgi:hypothetical protein